MSARGPDSTGPPPGDSLLGTPWPKAIAEAIFNECTERRRRPAEVVEAAGLPANFLRAAGRSGYRLSAGQLSLVGAALGVPPRVLVARAQAFQTDWEELRRSLFPTTSGRLTLSKLGMLLAVAPKADLLLAGTRVIETTAEDMAELLAIHPEHVAEHMRQLSDAGAYTVIRTEPERGIPIPVYELAPAVRAVLVVAEKFGMSPPPSALARNDPAE